MKPSSTRIAATLGVLPKTRFSINGCGSLRGRRNDSLSQRQSRAVAQDKSSTRSSARPQKNRAPSELLEAF
jgi:hypothetical protein